MFEKNEGASDRIVRTILGGGLLVASVASLGVTSAKPLGTLAALIGAVLLFTAATGSCLLCKLAGVNMSPSK